MKKSLFFAAIAAASLSLGSCSQDIDLAQNGNENAVTFTAQLPTELMTRADKAETYGKAANIDRLRFAVYKEDGTVVFSSDANPEIQVTQSGLTFSVSFNLVKGQTYDFVFWADNTKENYYTFNVANKTVTLNYEGLVGHNDNRDAFYNIVKGLEVTGAIHKDIKLYRPFAQINVGTNDIDVAANAKIDYKKAKVTVKDVYTTLNLFTGVAEGTTDAVFDFAEVAENELFPSEGHNDYAYLSMGYVLVGTQLLSDDIFDAQSEAKDVTIELQDATENKINTFNMPGMPFQRNYRTNLYGSLLTSPVDYTIEVAPGFKDPAHEKEVVEVPANKIKMGNDYYSSIADALKYAKTNSINDVVLYLGEGTYNAKEIGNAQNSNIKSIAIKGTGAKADDVVLKHPANIYVAGVSLSFENIKDVRGPQTNYIESTMPAFTRSVNETYKDCIFDGCVQIITYGTATFNNCTFNNSEKSGFKGYCLYYYGFDKVSKVVLNDCEFNTVSKAVVIYSEAATEYDFTANNCKFTASETDDKAAIQMHTELGVYGTVRINNCTATGFADPRNNGGLWNEHFNTGDKHQTTNFNIYVDGEQVQVSTKE